MVAAVGGDASGTRVKVGWWGLQQCAGVSGVVEGMLEVWWRVVL